MQRPARQQHCVVVQADQHGRLDRGAFEFGGRLPPSTSARRKRGNGGSRTPGSMARAANALALLKRGLARDVRA